MKNITIRIGRRAIEVMAPESWNDLPIEKVLAYYGQVFAPTGSTLTATSITNMRMIAITADVLGIDLNDLRSMADSISGSRKKARRDELWHDVLQQLVAATLSGLFEAKKVGADTHWSPIMNLTRCPWPILGDSDGLLPTLHAAADGWHNIVVYEFSQAATLYEKHIQTGDVTVAHRLLATIYRPAKPPTEHNTERNYEGDIRLPLRGYEATIDNRIRAIETLPIEVTRVLLFWAASCYTSIVNAPAWRGVFLKKSKKKDAGAGAGFGWAGLMLSVAGGPMQVDQLADQPYANLLLWLAMKNQEAEQLEADARRR